MFKQQKKMTVMDFTGIYENESFYKHKNIEWLDLHELQGVYGYCSQEARKTIEDKIKYLSPEGIHFIDSGNFHYVSEFWLEKIKQDFVLVVFDHHSDMVKPMFSDILSCGSWILNSLENNRYLKKVILIGIDEKQVALIPKHPGKVLYLKDDDLENLDVWKKIDDLLHHYPLYISIDKDVLSKRVVETDWDQGSMQLIEFKILLAYLFKNSHTIGIDICGECANEVSLLKEIKTDDLLNEKIISFLKEEGK
ncbi:MAG: arginase family protein [Bacillota bacterium]|nr:arginase family protein [Bacillota bacterium]